MGTVKRNPWEDVMLTDYEAHMSLPQVRQLQILNEIMEKQLTEIRAETVAILGVASGNGLEYVDRKKFKTVYGIDVNKSFLQECDRRFQHLKGCLVLKEMDLLQLEQRLPDVEYVIANLLIEYIGIQNFVRQIEHAKPNWVSCVIQENLGEGFVSRSPYAQAFEDISVLHSDIEEGPLVLKMEEAGYSLMEIETIALPNNKQFVKIEFQK